MFDSTARPAPLAVPRPRSTLAARMVSVPGPVWIYVCIVVQLLCQLALLVEEFTPIRVFIRSAAFCTSLFFLLVVPSRVKSWSAVRVLALVALAILTISMFNPNGGAPLAIVAHWTLQLAIIAPLFWVSRLRTPQGTLSRLLLLLWSFHTLGALLGVLQVYFPGHFAPDLRTITERPHLLIRLSSGQWIPRPTGLTDSPGGASADGLYAALLGIGVVLVQPFRFARVAGAVSMGLGLMCVYLSQVRSTVVMFMICCVVLAALFLWSGRASRATVVSLLIGGVAASGFYLALSVGGEMMTTRLASLIAADPGTVYYHTRGGMLEDAFQNFLPRYPLGAGLGHWGMVNAYFGSVADEIGSEIQVGGWILDGGLPLLLAYPAAVIGAIVMACRASRSPDASTATWATVVASYGVGAFALCFSYPLFMGTAGLEFWLTNAVLMQEMMWKQRQTGQTV